MFKAYSFVLEGNKKTNSVCKQ